MLTRPALVVVLALLGWACEPTPCRDTVLVVPLDGNHQTEAACWWEGATLEPIGTEHPGSLAYLCRCPVQAEAP